jgi:hypothetical protein
VETAWFTCEKFKGLGVTTRGMYIRINSYGKGVRMNHVFLQSFLNRWIKGNKLYEYKALVGVWSIIGSSEWDGSAVEQLSDAVVLPTKRTSYHTLSLQTQLGCSH